jgi:DNA (cytosine-5)-methyltransferase 1
MTILNLYAGIGGNRALWGNKDEVTAIESEQYIADAYKKLWPNDTVVVADAHQYLLEHYKEFDFIWSSPPCPTHSRMRTSLVRSAPVYPDMKLYEEILLLKHFCKSAWIVENVISYYEPLVKPQSIIDRHYIWSNLALENIDFERAYKGRITDQSKETLAEFYGIKLPQGTKNQRKLLRNAVIPDMGLYILNLAKEQL